MNARLDRAISQQRTARIVVRGNRDKRPFRRLVRRIEQLEARAMLAAGMLDTTFGLGGLVTTDFGSREEATAIAIQDDGKIVTVGGAFDGNAFWDFALTRHNPDGSLDDTFGSGGRVRTDFGTHGFLNSVAIQPDGKIVVAGASIAETEWFFQFTVARYNADGSLDNGFGTGGIVTSSFVSTADSGAWSIAIQADGKLVVAGESRDLSGNSDFAVARYNSDGSPDETFGIDGQVTTDFGGWENAYSTAVQADGKIVVAASTVDSTARIALARYNTNGSLDSSFGTGGKLITDFGPGSCWAYTVAVLADNKIVVAGDSVTHVGRFGIAQYNSDGSLDTSFGDGGKVATEFTAVDSGAISLAVQPDEKLVVSGWAGDDFALVRYNTDGGLDESFGNNGQVTTDFGASVEWSSSVKLQPDGRIVAGGFHQRNNNSDFALARYEGYDLSIGGTAADDVITVDAGTDPGTLKITVNGDVTDNIAVAGEVYV